MMKYWALCIMAAAVSCNGQKTDRVNGADQNQELYSRMAHADSLSENRQNVRAFVKQLHSEHILEVVDFDKWPDSIDVIYNVCYDSGRPVLYKEIPEIESGDFSIYYSYYADSSVFFALDVQSRYFDESCSESALVEHKLYSLTSGQARLQKYSLANVEGVSADSTACSFGRSTRTPQLYKTIAETPIADLVNKK